MPRPKLSEENALLAALPQEERSFISAASQRVALEFRHVLQEPGQPLEWVWFPHRGVVSMVSEMADGGTVELATIGREGMVGVQLVLDTNRMPQRVFCQVPGAADRLPAAAFLRLMEQSPRLRRLMLRYALTLFSQVAQGSACNRLHPVEARCARWMLMTHDRVAEDVFPLTQEFLGQMLGVTRPSVSLAAGVLQKAGLIRYVRGVVTVVDRPGLEASACECYRVITGEFRRLIEGAD